MNTKLYSESPCIQGIKHIRTGKNHVQKWPGGETEIYERFEEHAFLFNGIRYTSKICYGKRFTYGKNRKRVIIFINEEIHAEFLGGDSYQQNKLLLSEIKFYKNGRFKTINCLQENIPATWEYFNVVKLPGEVIAKGVHRVWAVAIKENDHENLIKFALIRKIEREKKREEKTLLIENKQREQVKEVPIKEDPIVDSMIKELSQNPGAFLDGVRREILRFSDQFNTVKNLQFKDKIRKMETEGKIPANIAKLIYFINTFRNSAVYDAYNLSESEVVSVANACKGVKDFISKNKST